MLYDEDLVLAVEMVDALLVPTRERPAALDAAWRLFWSARGDLVRVRGRSPLRTNVRELTQYLSARRNLRAVLARHREDVGPGDLDLD